MLNLEDQIKRYGDFLEGEALRGVELEVDAVEVQSDRSRFAIAAVLVLVVGLGMYLAVGGSPTEVVSVGEDEQITTLEQMALDHSDGIALEVVGDELWILGGGSDEAGSDGPYSVYVTGSDGELLRIIDLDRPYIAMGQSESYVWLAHNGALREFVQYGSGFMRISKESGDIKSISAPLGRDGVVHVFDDKGAWFEMGLNTLVRWDFPSDGGRYVLDLADRQATGREPVMAAIEKHLGSLYIGTTDGWIYKVIPEVVVANGVQLSNVESPVIDFVSSGDLLWTLQENGVVISIRDGLKTTVQGRCIGATHLVALPKGGVLAARDFETCEISSGGDFTGFGIVGKGEPEVVDSVVFAGQLWFATSYEVESLSVPLAEVEANQGSTRMRMYVDKSDGVAVEVVGDELWILGGGSAESGEGPFNIYVTGRRGELIRTIDVGRRFYAMEQSLSYVWLSAGTTDENVEPVSATARISKATEEIEVSSFSAEPGASLVFDDEGAWLAVPPNPPEGPLHHSLLRWETSQPYEWQIVRLSDLPEDIEVAHLVKSSDRIYIGTDTGWVYQFSSDGQTTGEVRLTNSNSPVSDLIVANEQVWALQENGMISVIDSALGLVEQSQCDGATYLVAVPDGVIAITGSEYCLHQLGRNPVRLYQDYDDVSIVNDSTYFAGGLWYASGYLDQRIPIPVPVFHP